jgi:uncharacterized protein YdcH (DUF465 family)
MSNFALQVDKDTTHLEELKRKHRELDEHIKNEYGNLTSSPEVYKLKTQKLWLKDEIHRIESRSQLQDKNS